MKKLENEVLLSRRAALGAFATVVLGVSGLLTGCGNDKATVTEDAGDSDKKEEPKDDMRKPLGSPPPRCSFFP
ncbi:hypothetical protein, partial [Collinsella aerofaciens]